MSAAQRSLAWRYSPSVPLLSSLRRSRCPGSGALRRIRSPCRWTGPRFDPASLLRGRRHARRTLSLFADNGPFGPIAPRTREIVASRPVLVKTVAGLLALRSEPTRLTVVEILPTTSTRPFAGLTTGALSSRVAPGRASRRDPKREIFRQLRSSTHGSSVPYRLWPSLMEEASESEPTLHTVSLSATCSHRRHKAFMPALCRTHSGTSIRFEVKEVRNSPSASMLDPAVNYAERELPRRGHIPSSPAKVGGLASTRRRFLILIFWFSKIAVQGRRPKRIKKEQSSGGAAKALVRQRPPRELSWTGIPGSAPRLTCCSLLAAASYASLSVSVWPCSIAQLGQRYRMKIIAAFIVVADHGPFERKRGVCARNVRFAISSAKRAKASLGS